MTARELGRLFKDAGLEFWQDNCPRLGASLAYYFALSLSPLLLVVVAIAGAVFGRDAARGEVVERLRDTIGVEAAAFVQQLIAKHESPANDLIATAVTIAVLFVGSSAAFAELQSALNTIWRVPGRKPKGSGITGMIRHRLLAFSLVCGSAFLVLASLVATAILAAVRSRGIAGIWGTGPLAQWLNLPLNFVLTTLLFAMIFRWLPDVDLKRRDVYLGAAFTALMFTIGRHLIGLYLGKAAISSSYGAAGAFVGILVWLYYSSQILLYGAELTFVYANRFGAGVRTETGTRIDALAPSS